MSGHPGWPAELSAGPVTLRPPRLRDGRAWSDVRLRNESWLAPWEPTSSLGWADRHLMSAWPPVLAALRKAARRGTMLPFVITYGGSVVGQMNVSNVTRGAAQSCTVGYWVDSAVAGRGIAPTALALVIDHCLTRAGLHRVEIDIRPENSASLRVVEKLGIRREAYYERFLSIDGAWRDHVAFAITAEERGGRAVLARLGMLPAPPAPASAST
jgi:[ribosomal protein S5]-alanine N-acetyltransferase